MVARSRALKSGAGLLLLVALLFLFPQHTVAQKKPAKGSLLIAADGMVDPRFQQSVILLLQHGPEGTVGLIVNKPLPISLEHALPDLPAAIAGRLPLFFGGPVAPGTISVLFSAAEQPEGSVAVLPGVFVTSAAAFLSGDGLQAEVDQLRILTGYAGWAPGQLERELKRGGWKVAPARAVDVFDADPESLWNYLSGKGAVLI